MRKDPEKRHRVARRVAEEFMLHCQRREAEELFAEVASKVGGISKTAGVVRFVKDYGPGEDDRDIDPEYVFEPKEKEPLAKVLWSVSSALGHLIASYSAFMKIKAANISPDGKLGGRGYVQFISAMREGFNECVATLSGIRDTISDEIHAPHWEAANVGTGEYEEALIEEMISDSDEIVSNPDGFVEEEYERHVVKDVEESLAE